MPDDRFCSAVRRMTRVLNAAPADARITFDEDGREVGRVYGTGVNVHPGCYLLRARWYEHASAPQRWNHERVAAVLVEQAADR